MPQPIRLRRSTTGTAVAVPAAGLDAEPFYAPGGFTGAPAHAANTNDLVISYGGTQRVLVGATRQVELIGAQIITGRKTFALAALEILGGANGEVLTTDGVGNLRWEVPVGGLVTVASDATLSGDGTAGSPLGVVTAAIGARGAVALAAGSAVTLDGGSAMQIQVATNGQIDTGTDAVFPISSAGLRRQMGADPLTGLTTTASTVVPAINEVKAGVDALSGNVIFGGSYDPAANQVTPWTGAGNPFVAGPLPTPTSAMEGYYLVITEPGTAAGPLPPAGAYSPGDWLIVTPATTWFHLDIAVSAIFTDGTSIGGDGLSPATPLEVLEIDGGSY